MKVAIIGAGVSGLASARNAVQHNVDCVVFEATDSVGGTWAYSDEVITDDHGVPVHASIYKSLRVNLPLRLMHFIGYKFEPESGLCYPGHEEVFKYIKDFTNEFNLYPLIKFQHLVQRISKDDLHGWKVSVKNLKNNETSEQYFDGIMICTGIYAKPTVPYIPHMETFEGDQIHSGKYRDNTSYRDKTVLVIGSGPSGLDITLECAEVAKKVYLCYRNVKKFGIFHEKVEVKPEIFKISANTVIFSDETTAQVDSIILCTGFDFHLPFLDASCGINVFENRIIRPLYKHFININQPTMCFIGIVGQTIVFPLVDLQAQVFVKHLIGLANLPSTDSMLQWEIEENQKKVEAKVPATWYHAILNEMREYFEDLDKLGQTETLSEAHFKMFYKNLETWFTNYVNVKKQKFEIIDKESFSWELEPDSMKQALKY